MAVFRHPSKRALREWLDREPDSDEGATAIDAHLDTCRRCAAILEDLERPADTSNEAGVSVGDALARFYAAPVDLTERLERKVVARLDSRVVIDVMTDLFGAGVETSKLLFLEDPTNE